MKKNLLAGMILALSASLPTALVAASSSVSQKPELTPDALLWQLDAEHGGASLRVVRPDGRIEVHSVGVDGDEIAFGFGDEGLPDGAYLWEISLAPRLTQEQRSELERAREAGEELSAMADIRGPRVQGSFRVVEGSVYGVAKGGVAPAGEIERASGTPTPQAAPLTGDLTVRNSLCVGFDCADSESYGADTIRLREDRLRIAFLDDSTAAGFPAGDWQIRVNEGASGGANLFAIDWLGTGSNGNGDDAPASTPFRIDGNAPSNSLFIASDGDVGVGTPAPALELHVRDGDSPALRLEQDTSSGFAAQSWDIAGNETSFFVRDVTNGSTLPFRVRPGADSNALVVSDDSFVGLGILSPQARLHVVGDARIDGALYQLSSRAAKTGFERPDASTLLDGIEQLWLGFWQYKEGDREARHFGPTAEDFHAAFGLGGDARHISPTDMAGIALGATQALREEIEQRDNTIADLERRLQRIEAALDVQPTH